MDGPVMDSSATVDELMRCPFVKAVAADDIDRAAALAAAPPDPAEPVVVEWLIGEARRQLAEVTA